MSDKDLEKIYVENIKKQSFDTISSRFLKEDDQAELYLGDEEPKGKDIDAYARGQKASGATDTLGSLRAKAKASPGQVPIWKKIPDKSDQDVPEFTNEHILQLNALDTQSKQKIHNLLDRASFTNLTELFATRGIPSKLVTKGVDDIVSSTISTAALMTALRQQSEGAMRLINTDIFNSPGFYDVNDLFITDPSGDWAKTTIRDTVAVLKDLGSGGRQTGPYEVVLSMLSPDIDVKGKGDIQINGTLYELKAESGRIGPEEWPRRSHMQHVVRSAIAKVGLSEARKSQDVDWEKVSRLFISQSKGITYDHLLDFAKQYKLEPFERYALCKEITDALYAGRKTSIPDHFQTASSPTDLKVAVAGELFRLYKEEKQQGEGKWDILVGINLQIGTGGLAVIDHEDQLMDGIRKGLTYGSSPNIIASGTAAARDYMYQFTPSSTPVRGGSV